MLYHRICLRTPYVIGYASDVTEIMKFLPKICQGFLMSATLSPELNSLRKVVLHSPAVLKLEEVENDDDDVAVDQKNHKNCKLTQLYLTISKNDKNLVLYVFLKVSPCLIKLGYLLLQPFSSY